jgi:DNA-binding MarR family transcriptional regulator
MTERHAELARLLRDTWTAVEAAMTAELNARGAMGLRRPHLPVLRAMNRGHARISEIARDVGVTRQAIAQTVAPLIEDGYLEIVPDPSDGRAKLLRWTERGLAHYRASLEIYDELERAYVARVGVRRSEQLRAELAELRAVAQAHHAHTPTPNSDSTAGPPRSRQPPHG